MAAESTKHKRIEAANQVRRGGSGRTRVLGALAGGAVLAVFTAEVARVWRLGRLTHGREEEEKPVGRVRTTVRTIREGYAVSRTRDNSLFTMLASFAVTFGITRGITWTIREHGGFGPIRDMSVGDRHIHHFIPGGVLSFAAGGIAIGSKDVSRHAWLAIPFGIGVGLVLDESALLLELDDVYWTEEGVVSVQIAFAAMALLSAVAYLIAILRAGEDGHATESDWETAAKAWDDLQLMGSGMAEPGIGI
jgi:hypothetical protein